MWESRKLLPMHGSHNSCERLRRMGKYPDSSFTITIANSDHLSHGWPQQAPSSSSRPLITHRVPMPSVNAFWGAYDANVLITSLPSMRDRCIACSRPTWSTLITCDRIKASNSRSLSHFDLLVH